MVYFIKQKIDVVINKSVYQTHQWKQNKHIKMIAYRLLKKK